MNVHLDDRALLHLVDRDASPLELDLWGKHVLACEPCAERLGARQRDTERVRVALSSVQLPPGFPSARETMRRARATRASRPTGFTASWGEQRWLRAAAVVLVLLLPVALVSPLRAALAEWLRSGWVQVAGSGERVPEPTPAAPPSPAEPAASYTVFFTPRGSELEVVVAERQAAGEIVLARAAGSEGSLEVVAGADETPLLADAGVTIRNTAGSRASYRLAVPASVERVRVRIGGAETVVVGPAEIARGWRAELR